MRVSETCQASPFSSDVREGGAGLGGGDGGGGEDCGGPYHWYKFCRGGRRSVWRD